MKATKHTHASRAAPSKSGGLETYPLESVRAASKMASKVGDNGSERTEYSKILMKESRDLASYIVGKRAG